MITNENLFTAVATLSEFDDLAVEAAMSAFDDLQQKGVIKTESAFDDGVWYTTDEYSNVGLHFEFDEEDYYQNYADILDLNMDDFVLYVKVFMVSLFGRNALETIRAFLLDLRHIVSVPANRIGGLTSELKLSAPRLCEEFLSVCHVEGEELEKLIAGISAYGDYQYGAGKKQRVLADYETYFLFNDILEDYWSSDHTDEERLFYFPLYLWWKFTAVIPLRPREFLLTQRDCLSWDDNGNCYLKIRRNQLKGGRENVKYKIADDYTTDTFQIPEQLGKSIEAYIALTEQFDDTEIDTLFVTDMHYAKWGQRKHSNSRFLTYVNLVTILHYFYNEVICGKYGLRVVAKNQNTRLSRGEISEIRLGDTRHIALINIMQEGGTPALAMFLAGHQVTETASHYYSNVSQFLECKISRQYRRITGGQIEYDVSSYTPIKATGSGIAISGGARCFSDAYASGSIEDCVRVLGPNSEIGYCPKCKYFRSSRGTMYSKEAVEFYRRNIEGDYNALLDAVETVRAGKGEESTVGEALLRLKASSYSYEQYLKERHKEDQ